MRAILPVVVVGELKAFALKSSWGQQRMAFLQHLLEKYPIADLQGEVTDSYARIDAYSQGKLLGQPLPSGMTARNMGKNDIWIAATALALDLPLHTNDRDFDHLTALGLTVLREPLS